MTDRSPSFSIHHPSSTMRPRSSAVLTRLLTCVILLASSAEASTRVTCKPILSFRNVREIRAPTPLAQPWTWKATVVADVSYCATRSGSFEIDFIRIKENAPDLQFTTEFRWAAGQFEVSMEMTADESILDYRLGFVAPCVCRELPFRD